MAERQKDSREVDEIYNPKSNVDDYYIPADLWNELPDLDYFRKKVERSLRTNPEAAVKHQRQLELLEDAILIYRVSTPSRVLHSEFLSEQVRVRIFLKKLLDT